MKVFGILALLSLPLAAALEPCDWAAYGVCPTAKDCSHTRQFASGDTLRITGSYRPIDDCNPWLNKHYDPAYTWVNDVDTAKQCCNLCTADDRCVAWQVYSNSVCGGDDAKKCMLLSRVLKAPRNVPDWQSGYFYAFAWRKIVLLPAGKCTKDNFVCLNNKQYCNGKQVFACPDETICKTQANNKSPCVLAPAQGGCAVDDLTCTSDSAFCLGGHTMKCAQGTKCVKKAPCKNLGTGAGACSASDLTCVAPRKFCLGGQEFACPTGTVCNPNAKKGADTPCVKA